MNQKKREISEKEKQECLALKAAVDAFNSGKPRRDSLTQGKIAEALDISQGAVSAYLNGYNALNARVAGVVAALIGVPVESFSPRLAAEIAAMSQTQSPSAGESARSLLERATPRSRAIVNRIIELERQGHLTDADLSLLQGLIERFSKDS